MPTSCGPKSMSLARVDGRAVVPDFGGGAITSDAGALLLGAIDRAIGLVARFAACFSDGRMPGQVCHDLATLVGQRVFSIALGYKGLVDHDDRRGDPALGAALGRIEARRRDLAPLAGKSALDRLEHAPTRPDRHRRIGHDPAAIELLCVDVFLDAHEKRRASRSISMPPTTRSTGGWRGASSTATMTGTAIRRSASSAAITSWRQSCGAPTSSPASWRRPPPAGPGVMVLLHADGSFARDEVMAWCEANKVDFLFGLARNARLVGTSPPATETGARALHERL